MNATKPPKPEPAAAAPVSASATTIRPFSPQRGLFIALIILFALWMAALLLMYFKTVYPQHHRAAGSSPASTQTR